MEVSNVKVNEKIKKYLEERGITQAFLAKKTGISHDKLYKIFNGKRKLSAQELGDIASVLNVDPNIFLV